MQEFVFLHLGGMGRGEMDADDSRAPKRLYSQSQYVPGGPDSHKQNCAGTHVGFLQRNGVSLCSMRSVSFSDVLNDLRERAPFVINSFRRGRPSP